MAKTQWGERLTDEQLRELKESAHTYTLSRYSPAVRLAIAEVLALRTRVTQLEITQEAAAAGGKDPRCRST